MAAFVPCQFDPVGKCAGVPSARIGPQVGEYGGEVDIIPALLAAALGQLADLHEAKPAAIEAALTGIALVSQRDLGTPGRDELGIAVHVLALASSARVSSTISVASSCTRLARREAVTTSVISQLWPSSH